MNAVFLILGGNEGDRIHNLEKATQAINQKIGKVLAASSIYETASWGKEQLPSHLNQVLKVETELDARAVLDLILEIETDLGRVRKEKWGMRIIDIDILFYNDAVIDEVGLQIPHPQIPNRRFTLVPLVEIAPEYIHPILQINMQEVLLQTSDELPVNKWRD